MVDMWIEVAENKKLSGVCMIDQPAAFDLLDHFLFPKKLKEYNFYEESIEWIQSYLGDRKQCVKIESKTSDLMDCEESGAPHLYIYWTNHGSDMYGYRILLCFLIIDSIIRNAEPAIQ